MSANSEPRPDARKAQRAEWKRALSAKNAELRRGRVRRKPPRPSGYRVPPPGTP